MLRGADLLVNLAGVWSVPDARGAAARRRAYVDWTAVHPGLGAAGLHAGLDAHQVFFSVGLNVGRAGCQVPTVGRDWLHTLPPVALERWPERPRRRGAPWTTVGHWRSYGPVTLDRVTYGQKAHSFRSIAKLPA